MSEPPAKIQKQRCINFGKGTIEVVIGAIDPVTFHVHEELVREDSEYFRRILSGNWSESSDRQVRMEGQEADVFNLYLNWLYRRELHTIDANTRDAIVEGYMELAKAYALGDYLQDIAFKNAVIDAFVNLRNTRIDKYRYHPDAFIVREVYETTTKHSKLRGLLVRMYAQCGEEIAQWFGKHSRSRLFPQDFLHDLAAALLEGRDHTKFQRIVSRNYHEACPSKATA